MSSSGKRQIHLEVEITRRLREARSLGSPLSPSELRLLVDANLAELEEGESLKHLLRDPNDFEGADAIRALADGLRPPKMPPVSEWCVRHRICTADRPEGVRWDPEQTPWLLPLLDAMHPDSPIRKVVIMGAVQTAGKSEFLWNFLYYYMANTRERALIVYPSRVTGAAPTMQSRVDGDIDAMEAEGTFSTRGRAMQKGKRSGRYYRYFFDGKNPANPRGTFVVGFGNSRISISGGTFPLVAIDEADDMHPEKPGYGPPDLEAEARTERVKSRSKVAKVSSPKNTPELSAIYRDYERADLRLAWEVPCPHCEEYMVQDWEHFQFNKAARSLAEVGEVYYECHHCKGKIEEYHRKEMNINGRLVDQNGREFKPMKPGNNVKSVALHITALSSATEAKTMRDLAGDFVSMVNQNNLAEAKLFWNTRMAKTVGDAVDELTHSELVIRTKETEHGEYRTGEVPEGYELLTFGADLAADRMDIVIWGVAENHCLALVDAWTIFGDPMEWHIYQALADQTMLTDFHHQRGGAKVKPWGQALDAQGQSGNKAWRIRVLDYTMQMRKAGFNVFAVAGAARSQQMIAKYVDIPQKKELREVGGRTFELRQTGVTLPMWYLDTAALKDILFASFRVQEKDTGIRRIRMPVDLEQRCPRFINEFISERKVESKDRRSTKYELVSEGRANHFLDASVYALSLLHIEEAKYKDLGRAEWNHIHKHRAPPRQDVTLRKKVKQVENPGLYLPGGGTP